MVCCCFACKGTKLTIAGPVWVTGSMVFFTEFGEIVWGLMGLGHQTELLNVCY